MPQFSCKTGLLGIIDITAHGKISKAWFSTLRRNICGGMTALALFVAQAKFMATQADPK